MVLPALKSGIRQMWMNKHMVLVFYAVNLISALLLTLPVWALLDRFAGQRLMGADFLVEFFMYNRSAIPTVGSLSAVVVMCYWFVSLFLSGGALSVFAIGVKYTPVLFWGSAARYSGRFFRLFLWCLPVAAVFLCLPLIEKGFVRLFFGEDPYQYVTYWGGWIRLGLRHMCILFVLMILDYARIHVVLTDERKVRRSVWRGITFTFDNFKQTFGLAFLFFVSGVVVLLVYHLLSRLLSDPNIAFVITLVVFQQLYMMFRMMLRLSLYAGQMSLYRTHTPEDPGQPLGQL